MTAAQRDLQRSLYETLISASELTALIGERRICDTSKRAGSLPCITLGQTVNRDWSTGEEAGSELTLHVWTSADSATEVHEIILTLRALLEDRPLTLPDGGLVDLQHDFTQVRIDPDRETLHGILRYRTAAEPQEAQSQGAQSQGAQSQGAQSQEAGNVQPAAA